MAIAMIYFTPWTALPGLPRQCHVIFLTSGKREWPDMMLLWKLSYVEDPMQTFGFPTCVL